MYKVCVLQTVAVCSARRTCVEVEGVQRGSKLAIRAQRIGFAARDVARSTDRAAGRSGSAMRCGGR